MRKSQARYKHSYDRRVPETPSFLAGKYVFVEKPTLLATSEVSADAYTNRTYNKLQQRTMGPFCFISVRRHTVTIDEHGIPNTVSIDRVTHALAVTTRPSANANELPNATNSPSKMNAHGAGQHKQYSQQRQKPTQASHATRLRNSGPQQSTNEYVVDKIVRQIGMAKDVKFVVLWYGYKPSEDTIKPADHIPQHFITRYWRNHAKKNQIQWIIQSTTTI